jgi:hypothetical protein
MTAKRSLASVFSRGLRIVRSWHAIRRPGVLSGASTDRFVEGLTLSTQWWGLGETTELANEMRAVVLAELRTEIRRRHVLYGKVVQVEAFFEPSDDVVVRLVDGTFALVHPTWSRRREVPPFPTAQRLGSASSASAALAEWESTW